jgi:tetratricopeptide (TPR) repeat protein
MEEEQNEIEVLRKGLQQFNQARHEDHYQLQSLLDKNLREITSLIENLPEKATAGQREALGEIKNVIHENPAQIGDSIMDSLTSLEENFANSLNKNYEALKERLSALEKTISDTLKESFSAIEEHFGEMVLNLNAISEHIRNYVEEFKKEREELTLMKKKEEARLLNDMAIKNFYAGRATTAIDGFKKAAELDKSSLEVLTNLGIALSKEGKDQEAQDIFKQVLEKDPDKVEALSGMGLIIFNEGDIDGAIDIFKQALGKDKGFASAYANLGFAYEKKEDINQAIENWDKALKLDPNLTDAKEALTLYKDRRVDGPGKISV